MSSILRVAVVVVTLVAGGCAGRRPLSTYERLRDAELTDAQWHAMLRDPEHQARQWWVGMVPGDVTSSSTGMAYDGLGLDDTPSHVLEHHVDTRGLLWRNPTLFASLVGDPDADVALTALYAYDRFGFRDLPLAQRESVIQEVRERALTHRDARVRWFAYHRLGIAKLLTPADFAQGLDDPALDVRATVAFLLVAREQRDLIYDRETGRLVQPDRNALVLEEGERATLAPILLDHLNDEHFSIRQNCATQFRRLFVRWKGGVKGGRSQVWPENLPPDIDWARADWATRDRAQQQWRKWWDEEGRWTLTAIHSDRLTAPQTDR